MNEYTNKFRAEARGIIAKLSLEQKVGQLFLLAFGGKDLKYPSQLVRERNIAGFYISQDNAETIEEAKFLTKSLQAARNADFKNLPLIFGVDQEGAWGVVVSETTTGPGNLALGATDDTELTAGIYGIYAQEMKSCGYNVILSPCADINSNPDNPIIGTRSFGGDRDQVAQHVKAAVRGALDNHIVCCAKHFPGHGDTGEDSHRLLPTVDRDLAYLKDQDLVPFQTAIDAGLPMIMTSHINFPQIDAEYPATLSAKIMRKLLREDMNFQGVVVTDSMNMWGMRKYYDPAESAVLALKAGCDLIMLSEEHYEHNTGDYIAKQRATIDGVITAVEKGDLTVALVDEALERIVTLRLKLAENDTKSSPSEMSIATSGNRELAEKAATKAIQVLRDEKELLPLAKKVRIVGLSQPKSHKKVIDTRGIGPNEPRAAFDVFKNEAKEISPEVKFYSEEELEKVLRGELALMQDEQLICITEDYPLPGLDYDLELQKERLDKLVEITNGSIVVCGLRSDYELRHQPKLSTYVCAYSSRACSARAMARFLFL